MEPGRYLVAESGVILARINQIKRKVLCLAADVDVAHPFSGSLQGSEVYVGINTGMNSLIRPALYQSFHRITNLTRCDSNDTVYE